MTLVSPTLPLRDGDRKSSLRADLRSPKIIRSGDLNIESNFFEPRTPQVFVARYALQLGICLKLAAYQDTIQ